MAGGNAPSPTPPKKSHVWVWVLIIILVLIFAGIGTCVYGLKNWMGIESYPIGDGSDVIGTLTNNQTNITTANTNSLANLELSEPVDETSLTDSQLAYALLTPEDMVKVEGLGTVRPSFIELNDHLDTTPPDNYAFFVGRSWYTPEANMRIGSAIVKNVTVEDARNFVDVRSDGKSLVTSLDPLGDYSVAYYESAEEGIPASMTYRFTVNTLAVKVQVFSTTDAILSDADIQAELTLLATNVAQAQLTRLQHFLDGALPDIEQTRAYLKVPRTLTGTSLVGSVPVTEEEWLGVTGEYSLEADVPGLYNGAMSRFSVTARPEEVVEVTALEFLNNSLAQSFQDQLLSENGVTEGKEITPPEELADAVDAIAYEDVVEAQIVIENYVIDVTLFSPFGEFDKAAAGTDVITMSQEIFNQFNSN